MAKEDIKNGEVYLIHSFEYTSTAIEEIRKLTKGLMTDTIKDFGLCGAIEDIARDTMEAHPVKIHCKLTFFGKGNERQIQDECFQDSAGATE